MKKPQDIRIDEYNYYLPESGIALYPSEERGKSKLLIYRDGSISKDSFYRIPDYLPPNSTLVFNNTKVIRARLFFTKPTGAGIELFLLEPFAPSEYQKNFEALQSCQWLCLIGNARKWKEKPLQMELNLHGDKILLQAEKVEERDGKYIVKFSWSSSLNFAQVLEFAGKIPLPPYIHRDANTEDASRYQTVYSRIDGSVAAPTAGLHFTDSILQSIEERQMVRAELTLHVGIATFRPVSSETIGGHDMHTEHFVIELEFLKRILLSKTIIAVGTTSLRTLESIYWLALLLMENDDCRYIPQWIAYESLPDIPTKVAIQFLIDFLEKRKLTFLEASTSILIVPGYRFKCIDGLITNFHLPKSTLILLVAALVGDDWKRIYQYALDNSFRFLSYGDSSLLLPAKPTGNGEGTPH